MKYEPTFTIDGREYQVVHPDEVKGAVAGDFFLLVPTERQMARERVKRYLLNRVVLPGDLDDGVLASRYTDNGHFELLISDLEILLGEREQ